MDHVCQQCGAPVEQGVPFCPKCNAPQIRVSVPEPSISAAELEVNSSQTEGQAASQTLRKPASSGIDWHFARSRSAIAAIIMVALMLYPQVSYWFFLWMPCCGALTVYLYGRGRPASRLSAGAGARMGATAGLMAFAVLVVLMASGLAIENYVMHRSGELVAQMRGQVQQAINASSDPQVRQFANALLSPNGLALILVLSAVFLFAMFLLLCALGGALGAMLLKRQNASGGGLG